MRSRLAFLPTAMGLLASVLLAGCGATASSSNGVASKTPAQIVAAAISAGASAATVHVAGSILGAGKPISIDMDLVVGKGGHARLTLDGFRVELIGFDRSVYVKGSAAFYRRFTGRASAALLRGKWLKGSAQRGALEPLATLTNLRDVIVGALSGHGALSRAGAATIDGRPAIAVSDRTGGGTLYVASTGAPYPLEILHAGAHAGKLVFDRWNKAVSLAAPTDAVDVDQLRSHR
ncbi:MAG TPA: hypothetical protein VK272_11630 [Solirubrobacteraceae bacterium]|nr:hypothetical protein [Solirubrobacteraceae bacterium]